MGLLNVGGKQSGLREGEKIGTDLTPKERGGRGKDAKGSCGGTVVKGLNYKQLSSDLSGIGGGWLERRGGLTGRGGMSSEGKRKISILGVRGREYYEVGGESASQLSTRGKSHENGLTKGTTW